MKRLRLSNVTATAPVVGLALTLRPVDQLEAAAHRMADSLEDAETTRLAIQARAGDADAFCALIELHQRALRRVAAAALGNHAEADEAVQEACVTAWQRIDRLDDPAAFRAWLLKITWRKALDRRRSVVLWLKRYKADARKPGSTEASDPSGKSLRQENQLENRVAARDTGVDEQLLSRERDRIVARMIRSLPARLRDPFLLTVGNEQRYEDVATVLGLPVGTVKWRVSEARRVLREKLTRVGVGLESS